MPTIRYLTPADYQDMCDILDKHVSGPGAYCNDRSAAPSADFDRHSKWYIDTLFAAAMTDFFGYFTDQGKLAAFCCFVRWTPKDVIANIKVEDPSIDLPRAEGARWSDAMIDLVNWAVGAFWSEGYSTFWTLQTEGQEAASFPAHPNCILNQYERVKVMDIAAGKVAPEEYRRVHWMPVFQNLTMFKYTDPLPLDQYLKVKNAQT
jgi:hypothetical protein